MEVQYGREKEIYTRGSETSQSKSQEVDFVLETVEQMVKYHGISLVGQVFKLLHRLCCQWRVRPAARSAPGLENPPAGGVRH